MTFRDLLSLSHHHLNYCWLLAWWWWSRMKEAKRFIVLANYRFLTRPVCCRCCFTAGLSSPFDYPHTVCAIHSTFLLSLSLFRVYTKWNFLQKISLFSDYVSIYKVIYFFRWHEIWEVKCVCVCELYELIKRVDSFTIILHFRQSMCLIEFKNQTTHIFFVWNLTFEWSIVI